MNTDKLFALLKECREKKRRANEEEVRFLGDCYKAIHSLILAQYKLKHTRESLDRIKKEATL